MNQISQSTPPLGVGTLLSSGFRTYFANFVPFYLAVAALMLVNVSITIALRPSIQAGMSEQEVYLLMAQQGAGTQILTGVLGMLMMAIMGAAVTRMTAEAVAGRPVRVADGFARLGGVILPLAVLMLIAILGVSFSMVIMILPGLWLGATWFVMIPAVVLGGAGFGGLGRSWGLSKGYRWPLVGLSILLLVILSLAMALANAVMMVLLGAGSFVEFAAATATAGPVVMALSALVGAAAYPLLFIVPTLTYLRLRAIKEGDDPDMLAEVFS